MLIIGEQEMANQTLSVRKQGQGDIGSMTLNQFVSYFQELVS